MCKKSDLFIKFRPMTPDTDKREWLGEWIYAKFVQNYEKLLEENKKLKEENKSLKERIDIAKWVPYKNLYNEVIPRDENWFYKEVKPTC
jgi:hypothetical protein